MSKLLLAARLAASAPLLAIGVQHLTGAAPMLPILEGAGLPFPELGAIVAPVVEVVAGALLLLGFYPRLGGLLAIGSMAGALVAHVRFDWADEPPLALPIIVMAFAAMVVVRGAGSFAVHSAARARAATASA